MSLWTNPDRGNENPTGRVVTTDLAVEADAVTAVEASHYTVSLAMSMERAQGAWYWGQSPEAETYSKIHRYR